MLATSRQCTIEDLKSGSDPSSRAGYCTVIGLEYLYAVYDVDKAATLGRIHRLFLVPESGHCCSCMVYSAIPEMPLPRLVPGKQTRWSLGELGLGITKVGED